MNHKLNTLTLLLSLSGVLFLASCQNQELPIMQNNSLITYNNPLSIPIADPFVLFDNGTYYLYGTDERDSSLGVPVLVSKDLVHWERKGRAFEKSDKTWSKVNFWGPEVIKVNNEFYMYYNASPNKIPNVWPFNVSLCIAKSDSPLGPFNELVAPFYEPSGEDDAIDQNIFIDDDGQGYIYFTFVTKGRNEIRVVKLKDSLIKFDGEPILCIQPVEPWENHPWNGHRVAEGAFMIKHKDYYYLTYTANHFLDPNYCIGYATSKNPMGPWEKYKGNPILKKTDHIYGPGNGMMVPSPDGTEMLMVYHTHYNTTQVGPRQVAVDRARFVESDSGPDILVIDGPKHTAQPLPSGAK